MQNKKAIFVFLGGIGVGVGISGRMLKQSKNEAEKYSRLYRLCQSWLMLKLDGEKLAKFFEKNKIKNIVVYGYGIIGRMLVKELEKTDVGIIGMIDRKSTMKSDGIPLYRPNDSLPVTDAVVITPFMDEKAIERSLQEKYDGKIIHIEDIIYDCI